MIRWANDAETALNFNMNEVNNIDNQPQEEERKIEELFRSLIPANIIEEARQNSRNTEQSAGLAFPCLLYTSDAADE